MKRYNRLSVSRPLLLAALLAVLATALVILLGVKNFRPVHGALSSRSGQSRDNWSETAMSCALDPQDGRPPGASSTRVSLLWLDPTVSDPDRWVDWDTKPDLPLRLDMIELPQDDAAGNRHPDRLMGVLRTAKHNNPVLLDRGLCPELELHTWPEGSLVRNGHPALGGSLRLDCRVDGRRLTGRIDFHQCGY